jgi:selenocysteine lyase/cysteine desulfurase
MTIHADQFPQADGLVYLNHAAVGPWPLCTYEAVERFAKQNLQQGARYYPEWVKVETELRERLRQLINAPSTDGIALLKNTSEALSVIAYGLDWQAGDNIVLADQEFPSNRIVWESLRSLGVETRVVEAQDPENPEAALIDATDKNTRLITTSSVQYASGLKMNLERLGEFCKARGILYCVDAIQSLGAFPFELDSINADFVVADGHKWMLGPEGLALFYCRPELLARLKLHQYGWHMVAHMGDYDRRDWQPANNARRFECGSPNMLGIYALHASLGLLLETKLKVVSEVIFKNISYLIELTKDIDGAFIRSPLAADRRAGIFNIQIAGIDNAVLHRYLCDHGVICAYRGGGIRLSPHFYNTGKQLEQAVATLKRGITALAQ